LLGGPSTECNLLYVDKGLCDARDVRTDPSASAPNARLHCSSLGKALLAALENERGGEGIIDRIGLERPATD
jgi:hypothetical protein